MITQVKFCGANFSTQNVDFRTPNKALVISYPNVLFVFLDKNENFEHKFSSYFTKVKLCRTKLNVCIQIILQSKNIQRKIISTVEDSRCHHVAH
jgi:hypothetical protein